MTNEKTTEDVNDPGQGQGTVEELQKQLERLQSALSDKTRQLDVLLEKEKSHSAEMKRKKEREQEALRIAEEEARKKGELEKAIEIRDKRMKELEDGYTAYQQKEQQWAKDRQRFALLSEIQTPGRFNAKVKPEHIIRLIDTDKLELDEVGKVKNWQAIYDNLIADAEYLKPTPGTIPAGFNPPPAGNGGAPMQYGREAHQLAEKIGLSVAVAHGLISDEATRKEFLRNGLLTKTEDFSELLK